jgi:hypothetical protein
MRSALMPVVSGSRARKTLVPVIVAVVAIAVAMTAPTVAAKRKPPHGPRSGSSFVGAFNTIDQVASTVPANGDVNPYGVAVAPVSKGNLVRGDVLVSNFNNSANLQGTGSTIVEISPSGQVSLFASLTASALPGACPGGIGLTTALVALKSGWVIVGSLPTADGMSAIAQAGCLIVLNSSGVPVETISGEPINGPWDMTALDHRGNADLFVTNVLNGTVAANGATVDGGTVVRIDLKNLERHPPRVHSETVIGQGFPARTDPNALVVGPTGLGLAHDHTLYVADSVDNRIAAIADAITRRGAVDAGETVSSGGNLNNPLGLAIAPRGDILTVNGGNGNLVETTPAGNQVAVKVLDNTPAPPGLPGNGTLFGLAVATGGHGVDFVDDGTNTLNLLH